MSLNSEEYWREYDNKMDNRNFTPEEKGFIALTVLTILLIISVIFIL